MSFWNAILFGIVQGFTEFFPVSSSAHLSEMFNLFGITASGYNVKLFSVFLHIGTILAALGAYWKDFGEIFFQVFDYIAASQSSLPDTRKSYSGVRLLIMMFFSCLPLAMLLPFNSSINTLYSSNLFIGIMLVLSGVIVFIAGQLKDGRKNEGTMDISDAIIIGICQCAAAIPGISRTGVLLTAGIAVGLKSEFALKFAVMISVPLMFVANIFHFVDSVSMGIELSAVPLCLLGMAVAAVSGFFAIKVLRSLIKDKKYHYFSYYSWVAGVIFIILTMIF